MADLEAIKKLLAQFKELTDAGLTTRAKAKKAGKETLWKSFNADIDSIKKGTKLFDTTGDGRTDINDLITALNNGIDIDGNGTITDAEKKLLKDFTLKYKTEIFNDIKKSIENNATKMTIDDYKGFIVAKNLLSAADQKTWKTQLTNIESAIKTRVKKDSGAKNNDFTTAAEVATKANEGLVGDKYYKGGALATGYYQNKYYVNGTVANGSFKVAGQNDLTFFKNGVVSAGTDSNGLKYDKNGKLLWEQDAPPFAFDCLRRENGNTIVSHLDGVTEFTQDHKPAWKISCADFPELKLAFLCGLQERRNGNLVIGTWANGSPSREKTTAFEITRDKKIIWTHRSADANMMTAFRVD